MSDGDLRSLRAAVQAEFLVSPDALNYTPSPSTVASGNHKSQPEHRLDMFILGHLIPLLTIQQFDANDLNNVVTAMVKLASAAAPANGALSPAYSRRKAVWNVVVATIKGR